MHNTYSQGTERLYSRNPAYRCFIAILTLSATLDDDISKRSGIVSDPNRDDDEEYIARLVGWVVTVSVETMKLIARLPERVVQEEADTASE
jgi:hypothetical protein